MIVSALLTSVGINSGLCILFFTLYSILRRQPPNYEVYVPRLLAEKGIQDSGYFHLERLLPNPGWIRRAWRLSEDELLALSGLDAVVFMRIIIFCLRVFSFAGILGVFVLLPINCSGDQLEEFNIANISSDSLDIFTISNVNSGSKRLWVHFCAVYLITAFTCFLLFHEYSYISDKRVQHFYSSKPLPHQFTILVRGIPVPPGSSISGSVDGFFSEYHPSTYLSHTVVHRTSKLQGLITEANKVYKRLTHLRQEKSQSNVGRSGLFGLFGTKVDLEDQYEKKLGDIAENLRAERQASAADEVRAAFVYFRTRYGAAIASKLQQSTNPTQWVPENVPEPHDVYWPFFHTSFLRRWISKVVVLVACILLTVLFLIPVVLVQGLTNLDQLETLFPFLTEILNLSVVSQVVTGYLPSLILMLFLKLVPPVMLFLSSIQGYISFSDIQKSACNKFLWFTIWNIFFANVLSGTVLNQLDILLDLKNIPSKLAVAVPGQASFFIAYVVTSGWTSIASELFRIIPFLGGVLHKCCCCCCKDSSADTHEDFEAPGIPYHVDIPRLLFFGLIGITYFFLAPLILPFLLVYFCLAYVIFKNQFINVYVPKYETGGRYWPIVHNSMIFSLVLMQAIAVGIFTLKKLPLASTLIFPLPVLTLLFNEYCRKRFLPNFTGYCAESLIKKDREDINDPGMQEFYSKLVTAYQDPAMDPLRQISDSDSRTAPLLDHHGS